MTTSRTTDTALDPMFLDRWSPRAYKPVDMPPADLATILDAARWAPSAFNYQPWRLLYALHGGADWDRFLEPLIAFNQGWAKNASVLLYILSETTMGAPDKPSHSHSFDAGAASAQLGLQASLIGYHAHGMTGVDFDKARTVLAVPEGLREREIPSDRKPLGEIAYPGSFRS